MSVLFFSKNDKYINFKVFTNLIPILSLLLLSFEFGNSFTQIK